MSRPMIGHQSDEGVCHAEPQQGNAATAPPERSTECTSSSFIVAQTMISRPTKACRVSYPYFVLAEQERQAAILEDWGVITGSCSFGTHSVSRLQSASAANHRKSCPACLFSRCKQPFLFPAPWAHRRRARDIYCEQFASFN